MQLTLIHFGNRYLFFQYPEACFPPSRCLCETLHPGGFRWKMHRFGLCVWFLLVQKMHFFSRPNHWMLNLFYPKIVDVVLSNFFVNVGLTSSMKASTLSFELMGEVWMGKNFTWLQDAVCLICSFFFNRPFVLKTTKCTKYKIHLQSTFIVVKKLFNFLCPGYLQSNYRGSE